MRLSRILLLALAPATLLALPSDTSIAVSPYAPNARTIPTYPEHVGSDESSFSSLQRRISEEENRRRMDDQETRGRLAEHDRLLGGLSVDARIVAERVTKIEDRLFYVIGLLLGLFLTSVWNAVLSQRIHRHVTNGKADDH